MDCAVLLGGELMGGKDFHLCWNKSKMFHRLLRSSKKTARTPAQPETTIHPYSIISFVPFP